MFSKSLPTGRTSEIVVQISEYKGKSGIDVRKFYHGEPTKKGAFLDVPAGQAAFVAQALPAVIQNGGEERKQLGDSTIVVSAFEFEGMPGFSIRKEYRGGYGKGIWVKADQAPWIAETVQQALAA